MPEITTADIRKYLDRIQGQTTNLDKIRSEFNILKGTKSFDAVRNIMFQLAEAKIVSKVGRDAGVYKVITQVQPISVFGQVRERKEPFPLYFPMDYETHMPLSFDKEVIIREGDLILISGVSNYGKTTLIMNFLAENIEKHPVLMGNEYTTPDHEPTPRFLSRLDSMNWVNWVDDTGQDKFTLLPVMDDYAEHIVKDKVNMVDWINIESGEHYMIGTLLNNMKRAAGKGLIIAAIQKAEGALAGRGGQFTKDFADLEILVDRMSDTETLLTIGKCKESITRVTGRSWAYSIFQGVKLMNVREVIKCPDCFGKGWKKFGMANQPCPRCKKTGWIDK